MERHKLFAFSGLTFLVLGTIFYLDPNLFPSPLTITRQFTELDDIAPFSRDPNKPSSIVVNNSYNLDLSIYRHFVSDVFYETDSYAKEQEMRTFLETQVNILKSKTNIGMVTESAKLSWYSTIVLDNSSIKYDYYCYWVDKTKGLAQFHGSITFEGRTESYTVPGFPDGTKLQFTYSVTNVPDDFKVSFTVYCQVITVSFNYNLYINDVKVSDFFYTDDTNINVRVEITEGSEYMLGGSFTIVDLNQTVIAYKELVNVTTNIWQCSIILPSIKTVKYVLCLVAYYPYQTRYFYNFGIICPKTGQKLKILPSIGGTTYPSGELVFSYGQIATIKAIPDEGYIFTLWILDGAKDGTSNPISINMTSMHSLQAIFTYIGSDSVTVTVILNGVGVCLPFTQGTYSIKKGTSITLYAYPSVGYKFKYFIINNSIITENPYDLTINSDIEIEVVFEKQSMQYLPYVFVGIGTIMCVLSIVEYKRKEHNVYY